MGIGQREFFRIQLMHEFNLEMMTLAYRFANACCRLHPLPSTES
jgi:hypothetical protein